MLRLELSELIIALFNRFMTCIQWHMAGKLSAIVRFGQDKRGRKFITSCKHSEEYLSTQEVIFALCSTKLCISTGKLPVGLWVKLKAQCKSMFEVFKWQLSAQTDLLTPV